MLLHLQAHTVGNLGRALLPACATPALLLVHHVKAPAPHVRQLQSSGLPTGLLSDFDLLHVPNRSPASPRRRKARTMIWQALSPRQQMGASSRMALHTGPLSIQALPAS